MNNIVLHSPSNCHQLTGLLKLTTSKSISNRLLIIKALCKENIEIENLAEANDTVVLQNLLQKINLFDGNGICQLDVQDAGTTARFLTAFLSIQKGKFLLNGSERMKQRPIGILVEALSLLNAQIEYVEQEGFLPLLINGTEINSNFVEINGNVSSQYISALLLIAPVLQNGLTLSLKNKVLSKPYILMTLNLMKKFGIDYLWEENRISIKKNEYQSGKICVEADWSSASYWYGMAVMFDQVEITLNGLSKNSLQGDSALDEIYSQFGIATYYENHSIKIVKNKPINIPYFEYDFIHCPDIAQTVAVTCALLQIKSTFRGIDNLSIKETDRVQALQAELAKIGAIVNRVDSTCFELSEFKPISQQNITIETYKDHRMAMAFAPLAVKFKTITILDSEVIKKSYPKFWTDLVMMGFEIK